jgi:hypothetical protein
MVIVLPNRDCLVYRWLYCGSYINMNARETVEWMFSKDNPNRDYNIKHYGKKEEVLKDFLKQERNYENKRYRKKDRYTI